MLQFPFGFRSTKQQYMRLTVVPAVSCRPNDISVDDSVDKPVRLAFDSVPFEKRSPGRLKLPGVTRAPRAVRFAPSTKPMRGLMPAYFGKGDTNLGSRKSGLRTHSS